MVETDSLQKFQYILKRSLGNGIAKGRITWPFREDNPIIWGMTIFFWNKRYSWNIDCSLFLRERQPLKVIAFK